MHACARVIAKILSIPKPSRPVFSKQNRANKNERFRTQSKTLVFAKPILNAYLMDFLSIS